MSIWRCGGGAAGKTKRALRERYFAMSPAVLDEAARSMRALSPRCLNYERLADAAHHRRAENISPIAQ